MVGNDDRIIKSMIMYLLPATDRVRAAKKLMESSPLDRLIT